MRAKLVMDVTPEVLASLPPQLAAIVGREPPSIEFEADDKADAERIAAEIGRDRPTNLTWRLEVAE